jgi:uncharacterized protein (TIGR03083 family)
MVELYDACLAEVERLAGAMDEDDLAVMVPATPDWTVHQVLAHLAGSAADAASGRMDGAPGGTWTARHVAERADRTPAELAAELRATQETIAAGAAANPRPAIVWNISVHLADLYEALDLGLMDKALWVPVLEAVAPYCLSTLPVRVSVGDKTFGSGGKVVEVEPYELYRALFSRRSRRQMKVWGSPELSDDQLDELPLFGPRVDDQPEPR